MGTVVAGLLVAGLALGWLADDLLQTFPIFALVGLVLGIAGACRYTYVEFRRFLKD
jgi:F0F1-type ATP synthase assembly protein I